jgi:hypothetical protein
VPSKALSDLIEPHYIKTSSDGGCSPYPLATLLRLDQASGNVQESVQGERVVCPYESIPGECYPLLCST